VAATVVEAASVKAALPEATVTEVAEVEAEAIAAVVPRAAPARNIFNPLPTQALAWAFSS